MSVQGMTNDISIFHFGRCRFYRFAIKLNSSFLDRLGVVFKGAIAEFIAEDFENLSVAPSLLAPLYSLLVFCAAWFGVWYLRRAVW